MNSAGRIAWSILCSAAILAGVALAPRIQAQTEGRAAAVPALTPVQPVQPAQALQQFHALSIESIALNSECQAKIQIRNTGAALTREQHAASRVSMGGKAPVSLTRVDPNGRLQTAGKLVGFVDEQPLTADIEYQVEVTLFNGKTASHRSLLKPQCGGPQRVKQPALGSAQPLAHPDASKAGPDRPAPKPGRIAPGHEAALAAGIPAPMRFKPQPFVPAGVDAPIILEGQMGGGEFAEWVTQIRLENAIPVLFRWTTRNPEVKFARWEVSTLPFAPGAVPEDWRTPILAKGSAGAAPAQDHYQTFSIDFSQFAPATAPSAPLRYFVRVRPSRLQLAVAGGTATASSAAVPEDVPGVASAPVMVSYARSDSEQTVFDNLPPSPYEVDYDLDGIPDLAEYHIAWKFKPYFIFDSDEGNRRADEPVVLFQVRPVGCSGRGCPGAVRAYIRYYMLWAEDGGYGPSSDCKNEHNGDNQTLELLVESTDREPYGIAWRLLEVHNSNFTWPGWSARFWADVLKRETHVVIYMSAHKHHQYFDTFNDEQDSVYSDYGCNDDVNGQGAVVFANLLSPNNRPNNAGEPESHPAEHFVNSLDIYNYPGECTWCDKDFKGGLGDDGEETSTIGWRNDPFFIKK